VCDSCTDMAGGDGCHSEDGFVTRPGEDTVLAKSYEPKTRKLSLGSKSRPVGTCRYVMSLLVLLAVAIGQAPPNARAAKLYWTDSGANKIQRVNTDGTGAEFLLANDRPVGIAVDRVGGKFYWTRPFAHQIRRANLDGTGEELLVSSLQDVYGIELDVGGGKMYWVEQSHGSAKFQRANLDGSNVELLSGNPGDVLYPTGIALDVGAGKAYYAIVAPLINKGIGRVNMDGTGPESLVKAGADWPIGIDLDLSAGKIYWTEPNLGQIKRANLDGSNVEVALDGVITPGGLALDVPAGKMYWTEDGTDKIRRANLDGSGIEDVVTSGIDVPRMLELDGSGGNEAAPRGSIWLFR